MNICSIFMQSLFYLRQAIDIEEVIMPTREEQKELRRQEIIAAALDLFIKKGYGGTRISDIAKAVHMSTGLLFHYYESKEKLYEELVCIGVDGPTKIMQQTIEDPLTFFTVSMESILGYMKENPITGKFFVLMRQVCDQEPVTEKIAELLPKLSNVEASIPIIKKGQELGQFKEGDPLALSVAIWGALQGIAETCAKNPAIPLPEARWIVDIIKK